MANEQIANLSLNPNSISDFTQVNVSEGMARNLVNNAMRQFGSMTKAAFAANTGTITSASTLTLASISTGDYILLTPGSTSITSFGTATEGLSKRMRALGAMVLRHDTAKLNLPSGADLSISTGDEIYARAQGGTVWNVTHEPYSGVPNAFVNAASVTASDTTSLLVMSNGTPQKVNASAVAGLLSGSGYRALSAAHTISAGDNGYVLNFTTAGVTCAFVPAASLSDGFTVTVMNTATTGDVTLNPDAAETLDGLSTRLLRPTDRTEILKAGSGFLTKRGTYSFRSTNLSISVSTSVAIPHGLGVELDWDQIGMGIVNETSDLGYTISDYVSLSYYRAETAAATRAFGATVDGTNINVYWGTASIGIINKSTLIEGEITPARWKLRVTAKVRYG